MRDYRGISRISGYASLLTLRMFSLLLDLTPFLFRSRGARSGFHGIDLTEEGEITEAHPISPGISLLCTCKCHYLVYPSFDFLHISLNTVGPDTAPSVDGLGLGSQEVEESLLPS